MQKSPRLLARAGQQEPQSFRLLNVAESRSWLLLLANTRERTRTMRKRNRKQNGTIIRIGDRWFVRYWERRNTGERIECKRVTHPLGPVTTRGKHPPSDIKNDAEQHMATVNGGALPAERIVTIGDFVERVYLPSVAQHKRPSTHKGYKDIWDD